MNRNTYKTTDFYSAVILRTFGIPLLTLKKADYNTLVFVFQNEKENCDELLKKYWDRKLSVEPRVFIESINELKVRIHQTRDKNYGS
jgi:protease II